MGMSWTVHAEMEDGKDFDVVADQRDVAKWEGESFGCALSESRSKFFVFLRYLGWSAGKRKGLHDLKWEEFEDKCIEVSSVDTEEPADASDPGTSAASDTDSSTSRGKRTDRSPKS